MDYATFEDDVWTDVNESTYTDQETNPDGVVVTIGETWQGTLYGTEENDYGQRVVHMFETENDQIAWFEAVETHTTTTATPHPPKTYRDAWSGNPDTDKYWANNND